MCRFARRSVLLVGVVIRTWPASVLVAQEEGYDLATTDRVGGRERFGLGFNVGHPFSGGTLSYFVTPLNAVQLEVGYAPAPWNIELHAGAESGLAVRMTSVGFPIVPLYGRSWTLPLFVGVGGGYTFNVQDGVGFFSDAVAPDSDVVSLFAPIGLQLRLRRTPVSFFAQVEPGVELIVDPVGGWRESDLSFAARVGMGAAYHF